MKFDIEQLLASTPEEPEWTVKDIIVRGSTICLVGDAGVGKSFLSYHLALCVASGLPFLGQETTQGKVVYFDQENDRLELSKYLRQNLNGMGLKPGDIAQNLIIEYLALGDQDWYRTIEQAFKEHYPALIVFDTSGPCFDIEDENSNTEATKIIKKLLRLRESADVTCTIVIIKHSLTSSDALQMRGAKAWKSATSATWFHIKSPGRPRSDGFHNTRLVPNKSRAFVSKNSWRIEPEEIGPKGPGHGIKLNGYRITPNS